MSFTYTPNYNLAKPAENTYDWGDEINANFDTIDAALKALSDALTNHTNRIDNPHQVTYVQTGAASAVHTHPGSDITSPVLEAVQADKVDNFHFRVQDNTLQYSEDGYNWSTLGPGDMLKAVYDVDDDGIVDNAKRLDGYDISAFPRLGDNNQSINLFHALNQQIDTRSLELVYDESGNLVTVYEKDGETTVKTTTLEYDSSGNLSTITEQVGGKTIITTLSYDTNGNLSGVSRQVS